MDIRRGFTLAEVLITLSIIGVVAALTIPSLVVKNQEKETIVQLKKTYSVLSNAFALAQAEYGAIEGWGWGSVENNTQGSINVMSKLSPFLNIIRRCDGTTGCWPAKEYKNLDGSRYTADMNALSITKSSAIFADGTIFHIYSAGSECRYTTDNIFFYCGTIIPDVNGFKGPNTWGKDLFSFAVTPEGIFPSGTKKEYESTGLPFGTVCQRRGDGCTAWALIKENLNYPKTGEGWQ